MTYVPPVGDATDIKKGLVQLAGDLSGTAAAPLVASNTITEPKLAVSNSPASNQVLSWNGSAMSWTNLTGGSVTIAATAKAYVYQDAGNTIAIRRDGSVISTLATTAANNTTVINAAIDDAAGALVAGSYGNGGLVQLSDNQFSVSGSIVIKYGVSLRGISRTFDRGGSVYNSTNQCANGTSLRATTNNMKVITAGVTTSGNGVHLATNPHGFEISHLQVDGHGVSGATGIYIKDVTDPKITSVTVADCAIGIDVDSSQPPNEGGTVACKIIQCDILGCSTGINVNGASGGTDSEITSCRILGHSVMGVVLSKGGWQIAQCHMTSSSAQHLDISGSPAMVTGNYLDTSGVNPQITISTGNVSVVGNYFTCSGTQLGAAIEMSGNGYRSVISSNTCDIGANTTAFVKLPTGTVSTMPVVILGNSIDVGVSPNFVAIVTNSSGVAVADQDTVSGPYIKGNRTFAGDGG